MAGKDPGFVETFARGVAENLLGSNSKGFSRIMDERSKEDESRTKAFERKSAPYSLRKGGKVQKSGRALLHKGEMVARKTGRAKRRGSTR